MNQAKSYYQPFWVTLIVLSVWVSVCVAQSETLKAPDFKLKDTSGKIHTLSQYKGKVVVLEFFNPDCPFIKRAHQNPDIKALIRNAKAEGVIWLGVNSNAAGKQGATLERNLKGISALGLEFPILLNPNGDVGKAYNATRTPEVFLIGKEGTIRYRGAVDSSGGSKHATKEVQPFLKTALKQYQSGQPITAKKTKPWGCSIKY